MEPFHLEVFLFVCFFKPGTSQYLGLATLDFLVGSQFDIQEAQKQDISWGCSVLPRYLHSFWLPWHQTQSALLVNVC